jgi:hypothetical protein
MFTIRMVVLCRIIRIEEIHLFHNQQGSRPGSHVTGLLFSRAQTILAHQLARMSGFAKPVQHVGNHQQRVVQ